MVNIELFNVGKSFPIKNKKNQILKNINLILQEQDIIAIRGDNGCGKTTLLNIIAGIDKPTEGKVNIHNLDKNNLRIGYVQQDYTSSLLPWFDNLENIAIPLRLRGYHQKERRNLARNQLDLLGFKNLPGHAYPHQLSGGQKQRVAIARSLIHNPHVLILDEPFSNLDAHTSRDLQETLLNIHRERKIIIIYVSHELDHCIYLSNRILLLYGSPACIFKEFRVNLDRPRRREQIFTSDYNDIRSQILIQEESLYG